MGSTVQAGCRAVTDDEVEAYHENGWVMLEGFIEPELAHQMLDVAKSLMGPDGAGHERREGVDVSRFFNDYQYPAKEGIEPFKSLTFSMSMVEAVRRLMDRDDVGVRYGHETIAARPGGSGQVTEAHQDFPSAEFDRVGYVNFWMALDEVPPERGSMRFYNGSHKAGPLGIRQTLAGGNPPIDLLETYPKLEEKYPLSPPLHYKPGDVTAHQMLTIHGAPANNTDQTRWAYSNFYLPADVRRIAASTNMHGSMELGELVDGPETPLIWEPSTDTIKQ